MGFDSFFEDIAWALNDENENTIDSGLPTEAGEITRSYTLADGDYCLTITDAFGDGGVSGVITLDGVEWGSWLGTDYGPEAKACFTVLTACVAQEGEGATYDACGVCDANPENDCVEDCNGQLGGDAKRDACGTCDADMTNDCPATEVVASITADQYSSETSWTLTNASQQIVQAGAPSGPNATDESTWLLADGFYCFHLVDSYGDGGASGTLSVGDTALTTWTGADYTEVLDYCFTIGADCHGVDGGLAYADECGTCDEDTTNDCSVDCAGSWGGIAALDACNTCDTDAANDCTPNAVITLTPDAYFTESSWVLVDSAGTEIAGGAFESEAQVASNLQLADGEYCLNLGDTYGDGGLAGNVSLNGTTVQAWEATSYTTGAELCFTVDTTCFATATGAVTDACGVCDADQTNNCTEDCNGVLDGDAVADACGTCDNDASNDCESYSVMATFDADSYYTEITWGLLDILGNLIETGAPAAEGSFSKTWDLVPGRYCMVVADSYGDGGMSGLVTLDETVLASWDATDYAEQHAACFTLGNDCEGTAGGEAYIDHCGTCDSDPSNDCVRDCEGTWGGSATGCGNVTVWLSCDEQFTESRWAVANADGYLDQGAPAAQFSALGFQLETGSYTLYLYDSASNGGCGGTLLVDGVVTYEWLANGYSAGGAVEFTVP